MNVPFFNLSRQYAQIKAEIAPIVLEVLESCAYIGGKYVQDFEKAAAEFVGAHHAVGCANGTDALVLALRACGVRPGDEVITTPFTFFATAEAIASIGAIPVFVDILPGDFTINPDCIEKQITSKTKAILPVHLFGAPCDMDAILKIAHQHEIRVVEDAAQAIGSTYQGRKIGSTADISCFSFYPTKNLGAMGDGGLVTTSDENLHTMLLALREHGAAQNGVKARALMDGTKEEHEALQQTTADYNPYKYLNSIIGYNSRLDAVQAAILSQKLGKLDAFNAARTKIAAYYTAHLCSEAQLPVARADGQHCWHQYVIRTKYKEQLCAHLNQMGVGVGTFYPIPLHLQKAFDYLGYQKGSLPEAEKAAHETVCLPIFPELTEQEMAYVADQVNAFYNDLRAHQGV